MSVGVLERYEGCSPTQIAVLQLAIHSVPTHSGMDPSMGYSPSGASPCESFMGQFLHGCPCLDVDFEVLWWLFLLFASAIFTAVFLNQF